MLKTIEGGQKGYNILKNLSKEDKFNVLRVCLCF